MWDWDRRFLSDTEDIVMEEPLTTNQSTEALLKATVGDLLIFVNWMHLTHNAFERGDPPPPPPAPAVESGRIRAWVD